MQLRSYRSAWGAIGPDETYADAAAMVTGVETAGYDGIEITPLLFQVHPPSVGGTPFEEFLELLGQTELELLPLVMTFGSTVDDHVGMLRSQLELIAALQPRLVIAHAGADWFSDAEAAAFLRDSIAMAADHGLRLAHETHRTRILYNPWRTVAMLEQIDDLWLNADLSHFVIVAERMLADQADVMAAVCERSVHIHTRVGTEQHPQVPDPRVDEWQPYVEAYEAWWDQIWRAAESRGDEIIGETPEWGPPGYQPTHPVTGERLADLAEICDYMVDRGRKRFADGSWRNAS